MSSDSGADPLSRIVALAHGQVVAHLALLDGKVVSIKQHPTGKPLAKEVEKSTSDLAAGVLSKAAEVEPGITEILVRTVAQNGGRMAQLKNRLKENPSLTRKIKKKALEKGITEAEYAGRVGDALRYTAVIPWRTNIKGGKRILAALAKAGHHCVTLETAWTKEDAYAGINMNFRAPNGFLWELQLHTPESVEVKGEIHELYDVVRDLAQSPEDRQAANDLMVEAWKDVPQPTGWYKFGRQIHRPFALSHGLDYIRSYRAENDRHRSE